MKRIEKTVEINPKGKHKVLIIAGTHGDETHAVKLVWDYYKIVSKENYYAETKKYDKDTKLSQYKSISFIIGLNETGLVDNTRTVRKENKDETLDLNRSFKSSEDVTKKLIVDYVKNKIKDYDIVIDVHNSVKCLECALVDYDHYTSYMLNTISTESKIKPIVRAANANAATIKSYTNSFKNKLGYTIEIPYLGYAKDEFIPVSYVNTNGAHQLSNFIRTLNVPNKICKKSDFSKNYQLPIDIYARMSGIIDWVYNEPIRKYKKDDLIAKIEYDDEVENIYAPFDGYLFDISGSYIISKGDSIGEFGNLDYER